MCGICGVRRFGPTPITETQITTLLVANEKRGNHATGLVLQQASGDLHYFKNDVPAWQFVHRKDYEDFLQEHLHEDTLAFLGHTRFATQGHQRDNKNNHPICAGKTAVVHNGMISNDDSMFKDLKLERKCETDSDIIRAVLDEHGFTRKAMDIMNRLSGSAAFAAVSPDFPGKLILGRSGNPIVLCGTKDQLIWSSEKDAIYRAVRPYHKRFGFVMRDTRASDVSFIPMNNDSVYCIGQPEDHERGWEADWIQWHQQLHIAYGAWQGSTYSRERLTNAYRGVRTRIYGDTAVDVVQCPNGACGAFIPLGKTDVKELKRWKCKECGTRLVKEA